MNMIHCMTLRLRCAMLRGNGPAPLVLSEDPPQFLVAFQAIRQFYELLSLPYFVISLTCRYFCLRHDPICSS